MPKPKARSVETQNLEGRRKGINTGLHYTFCGDHVIVGPEWRNLFGSLFLIGAPVGVWMGFLANPIGRSISWAVVAVVGVLFIASIVTLFLTAFVDPGFLPRDEETNRPDESGMSKEHVVNGYVVNTKWCSTCNHYRPPRCSHCAVCDNCVLKFDHHCPWVGTCVGERNYPFFLAFLSATTALDCLVFAFTWVRLVYMVNHDGMTWKEAVKHEPANIAVMIYTFVMFFFVGGLFCLHVYFTTQNTTTYEHFRARYNEQGNPFDKGLLGNWASVCCRLPPKRLKETLPFRPVDEGESVDTPVSQARGYNGSNGSYAFAGQNNNREQEDAGRVEMSNMEEGRRYQGQGVNLGRNFHGASSDEDITPSARSQRRIPMIGSFGPHSLLDSCSSGYSEADQIRTHHSVVVIHDDNTGSGISTPTQSGELAFSPAMEDTARLSQQVQEQGRGAFWTPQGYSMGPPTARGSEPMRNPTIEAALGSSYPTAASPEVVEGGNVREGGMQEVSVDQGAGSSEGTGDFKQEVGEGPQTLSSLKATRESLDDGSEDGTYYGSPKAMSVWPSSEMESFRTAGSITGELDPAGWGTSSRSLSKTNQTGPPRSSHDGAFSSLPQSSQEATLPSGSGVKNTSSTSTAKSDPEGPPAHTLQTKGEPEEIRSIR